MQHRGDAAQRLAVRLAGHRLVNSHAPHAAHRPVGHGPQPTPRPSALQTAVVEPVAGPGQQFGPADHRSGPVEPQHDASQSRSADAASAGFAAQLYRYVRGRGGAGIREGGL